MLPEPGAGWPRLETESAESNGSDNLRFGSATIRWNVFTKIDKMDSKIFCWNEIYRCRGNTLTMCEFHESTCNGFGDIWWTDNPIYFSSIDVYYIM